MALRRSRPGRRQFTPLSCECVGSKPPNTSSPNRERERESEHGGVSYIKLHRKHKKMHSVTLDSSGGSPRKRTISRGLSEDESLRSIIKEVSAEITTSFLTVCLELTAVCQRSVSIPLFKRSKCNPCGFRPFCQPLNRRPAAQINCFYQACSSSSLPHY